MFDPLEEETVPTPDSCQDNPMDKRAWQATVHGVAKSWTRLDDGAQLVLPKI